MTPSQKISIIERSMRCCRFGYWSLIPAIGFVTAIFALRDFRFVRGTLGKEWNPARRQLNLGITLAITGVVISTVILCFVVISIVYGSSSESGYNAGYVE